LGVSILYILLFQDILLIHNHKILEILLNIFNYI